MLYDDRCECFEIILNKWSSLLRWRSLIGVKDPVVVATNGCFDILHAGHVTFLQEAAAFGTHLVIGLNGDESVKKLKGEGRPIHQQEHRKTVLESLRCVSHVHIFDEDDCSRFLIASKPDIYVKAGDYTIETLNPKERAVLEELGSTILFTKYIDGLSTTSAVRKLQCLRS